jgi:hypothetical protein
MCPFSLPDFVLPFHLFWRPNSCVLSHLRVLSVAGRQAGRRARIRLFLSLVRSFTFPTFWYSFNNRYSLRHHHPQPRGRHTQREGETGEKIDEVPSHSLYWNYIALSLSRRHIPREPTQKIRQEKKGKKREEMCHVDNDGTPKGDVSVAHLMKNWPPAQCGTVGELDNPTRSHTPPPFLFSLLSYTVHRYKELLRGVAY